MSSGTMDERGGSVAVVAEETAVALGVGGVGGKKAGKKAAAVSERRTSLEIERQLPDTLETERQPLNSRVSEV